MILSVSRKRAFRNIFRSVRGRVYKSNRECSKNQNERSVSSRHTHSGSFLLLTFSLLTVTRALREIKYYQKSFMNQVMLISQRSFSLLVKQIIEKVRETMSYQVKSDFKEYR